MRTHSFPSGNDLITGSDIGSLEPKWPTACVRVPPGWTPALGLLDRTLGVLLQIDRAQRSSSCPLTCPLVEVSFADGAADYFRGASRGACATQSTSNFRLGSRRCPQFNALPARLAFLLPASLIHYLLATAHDSECNSSAEWCS